MKTTLDLPDSLMRAVKVRAAKEDKKLKDMVAGLLERGLVRGDVRAAPRKRGRSAPLPVIECRHAAGDGGDPTPEDIADILVQQEVGWSK